MDRDSEMDFHDFVASRSTALLGTAYLLTGDRHRAEDGSPLTPRAPDAGLIPLPREE